MIRRRQSIIAAAVAATLITAAGPGNAHATADAFIEERAAQNALQLVTSEQGDPGALLNAASEMLEGKPHTDDLKPAVNSARAWFDISAAPDGSTGNETPLPGRLARKIVARYGVAASPTQSRSIAELDELPAPVSEALSRVFVEFDAFADAAGSTYATMQPDLVAAARAQGRSRAWPITAPVDVDLNDLAEARTKLLRASLVLAEVLDDVPRPRGGAVVVAPGLCIDLQGANNTYATDCALHIDVGGNDTYLNNAGGSNLLGGSCTTAQAGAGALLDFGGNDTYGDGTRTCGANGGGYNGAGFLLDLGSGNDSYAAGDEGTNGGGSLGAGFLLDGGGNDHYEAGGLGTNGGGDLVGAGFLLDAGGNDVYDAGRTSVNGGGSRGAGFLLDVGGNDTYLAGDESANGGSFVGAGFLLDTGGNDTYAAGSDGINGGGNFGTGFLYDATGNDSYSAGDLATNGGGRGGPGFLLDGGGNDSYTAGIDATNGGGILGTGLLLDAAGADFYQDPLIPTGSHPNCTLVPKDQSGMQLDLPNTDC